jgi:transposase
MYNDTLRRLRDAVRRKRFEKWATDSWFLLYDNAPAHRTGLVKDFPAKNNPTTTEYLPCSPGLAAAHFHLFSRLKLTLKGRRFCNTTDIIKNVTEELNRRT